jgi:glycosyltransferase involved in cell wall biosynthesis
MNILMLLDREFPPDIRVENEALSLLKEGHAVHVLSYNFHDLVEFQDYKGIQVHRFGIHEQVAKKSLGLIHLLPYYYKIWEKEVLSLIGKFSFDAIHIHDLPLCTLAPKLKKLGFRIIADMHENYPYLVAEQPYMNSFVGKLLFSKSAWFRKEKEWLDNVDEIVCVAEGMKERLKNIVSSSIPISVVPNTYSFDSFGADQREVPDLTKRFEGKFVVSYIGGFDQVRGIPLIIEAVKTLGEQIPEIKLLLVGDGPMTHYLKQLVTTLKIDDLVDFEGWLPSSQVKSYIEVSSVCVIPHIRSIQTDNSSPNKIFQYMYCSKPVITSNCTALEKIIVENNCGLVFTDMSANELAQKILFIYKNKEIADKYGINGHDAVMSKFNWESTVKPLLDIYKNKV